MNRLAIFDCDGTLVDSGATIYAALGELRGGMGWAAAARVSRRVIGLSLVEAMAALRARCGRASTPARRGL